MQVEIYRGPVTHANCYLLRDEDRGVVIDPAVSFDDVTNDGKIEILAILLTHAHFDHILELPSYIERCAAPVYLHKNGFAKLNNPYLNCSVMFPDEIRVSVPQERLRFVAEGSEITALPEPITVIEASGHCNCSVIYRVSDLLFTGDTLFKGVVGRTDLPGSSLKGLVATLTKLKGLDPDLTVFPGHGMPTTLGREIRENPYMPR